MTSPILLAKQIYETEPCRRSWEEDFAIHLHQGWVISTPDYFIMGRPVVSSAAHADMVDPRCLFDRSACDCWFIYAMAGEVWRAWDNTPFELPLVAWEKRNEVRGPYPMAQVRERVTRLRKSA